MKRQYFLVGFTFLFLQACQVSQREISKDFTLFSYVVLFFVLVLLIPAYYVATTPKRSNNTTVGEVLAVLITMFATLALGGFVIGIIMFSIDDFSKGFGELAILKLLAAIIGVVVYINVINKWGKREKYTPPKSTNDYDSLIADEE